MDGPLVEDGGEITEEPWSAEAATADHHTVATGGAHHAQRIVGFPDVAVAEDGDRRDGVLEFRDATPVGVPRVELVRRAGVERDGLDALILRNAAGVEERDRVVVDTDSELDRDRHITGVLHGGLHDLAVVLTLPGSAAPPPWRVTFFIGQPKFMSMWSTGMPSTQAVDQKTVASPMEYGSVP